LSNAVHPGIKPIAVGNVHRCILRPHDIEAAIIERKVVRRQTLEVLPSRSQSRENYLPKILTGVVGLDGIIRHFCPQPD
jgi:hypothetical protein